MMVLDSGRVLRSGHTRDVFADPRSITAARLTGCKNILPCTRLDAHAVRLTGWDVPLQLALRRGHPRPRLCALRCRGTERLTGSSPFFQ
jgi:ABC-type sulfate/molybdate transport systems ATPase subunit